MKLKIKNIDKLPLASLLTDCKCMDYNIHPDMYEFILRHRNFAGEFRYMLMRDVGKDSYGNPHSKYVGTFRNPFGGSNRQDCYGYNIQSADAFLEFMDIIIQKWYVEHHQ